LHYSRLAFDMSGYEESVWEPSARAAKRVTLGGGSDVFTVRLLPFRIHATSPGVHQKCQPEVAVSAEAFQYK
jgi:hypothetical protein